MLIYQFLQRGSQHKEKPSDMWRVAHGRGNLTPRAGRVGAARERDASHGPTKRVQGVQGFVSVRGNGPTILQQRSL